MTDTCMCPPNDNTTCFSSFGVNLAQPTCQIIPDGTRVENPYYDSSNNISYYSYELLLNCGEFPPLPPVGNFVSISVAICESIPLDSVLNVGLLLDSCPSFQNLQFDFNEIQSPPPGFRFLRILLNQAITPGSAGTIRLALQGNYPPESPPTSGGSYFVVALTTRLTVTGDNSPITLPGCPAVPRLSLTKTCEHSITDNSALLSYRVVVANTGETDLSNVTYQDILNYDGANVTLGQIVVTPEGINVDTSVSGIVEFTGNLGDIPRGTSVEVLYTIPIQAFAAPNTYTFTNMAVARSGVTEGSASCTQNVEVIEIITDNCCIIDGSNASFIYSLDNVPNSPSTMVTVSAVITIPNNLVVQFDSFGNCTAQFASGAPVPINTDITGTQIFLICDVFLTENATVTLPIDFRLISLSSFNGNPIMLISNLSSIVLQNPDAQILLRVTPIPNTETIDVNSELQCQNTL